MSLAHGSFETQGNNATNSNRPKGQGDKDMSFTPNKVELFHADHGLTDEHLVLIDEVVENHSGFFIEVIELPEGVPSLQCGLYGPAVGDNRVSDDEVTYEKRGSRPGPSRLVDRPTREARRMVVIGIGTDDAKVFTAYGTRAESPAPREWWDISMVPTEAVEAAQYWCDHALSKGA